MTQTGADGPWAAAIAGPLRAALDDLGPGRRIVALAGPPGAGKSTLSAQAAAALPAATVLPMDGYHLDNAILAERGLMHRKGSPDSFDAAGFLSLLRRLGAEDEVIHPIFDRDRDLSIAGAGRVGPEHRLVLVEGNYLLLKRPVWRDLAPLFDLTVMVTAERETLAAREHRYDARTTALATAHEELRGMLGVAQHAIAALKRSSDCP